MFRHPVEFASRLRAAQAPVERMAPRPFGEFGGDRIGGDDLRLTTLFAQALARSARKENSCKFLFVELSRTSHATIAALRDTAQADGLICIKDDRDIEAHAFCWKLSVGTKLR
jgi:hypothetical protein